MKIKKTVYSKGISSLEFTVYRFKGASVHTNKKHHFGEPLIATVEGPIIAVPVTRAKAAKTLREVRAW